MSRPLGALTILGILSATSMSLPSATSHTLVELAQLDRRLVIEARYASADNFVGKRLYPENRLFLVEPVAQRIAAVNADLRRSGVRLKIWDAYRPRSVQKRMWELVPDERYVADPMKGSNHNRGCAVDATLVSDAAGAEPPDGNGF